MIRLSVRPVTHALRAPLRTAWGVIDERHVLRVRLDFPDGTHGEGEAAPLEPYDGVSLAAVRGALDRYAAALEHAEDPLAACRDADPLPQALAAIDLALWDRRSKLAATPVAALIDPRAAPTVPVNATIGAADDAAAEAARAARAGFRCVKLKVGTAADEARLAQVRAAVGPDVAIRVDANGAFRTPDEALERLRTLARFGLELCEEPVHGVEAIRAVARRSPVPIAMDETHAPGSGAAPLVCLKVSRGGITQLLHDAAAARAAGSGVYLASTLDGPLGIAAAVHAAAALRVDRPCGLATLADPDSPLQPRDGAIAVPSVPGLA